VKSVVSRIRRRNKKEGEAEPNCPSLVPTKDRFSLDVSSDEEVDYYDAASVIAGLAAPHGPTPADRRLSQNPPSSNRLVSPVQSRTPSFRSTSSQQTSQNSTFALTQRPEEDQRPEWQRILESDMWNNTPFYAGTLSGVSRISTDRGNSETPTFGHPDDGPSAYEIDAVRREAISRRNSGLSGTTLGTSPVSQKSSNVPWASEKSGKTSKYVLVKRSPSELSLDPRGRKSRPEVDFSMLDTRLSLRDQTIAM